MASITITELSKTYDDGRIVAVDGINLELEHGKFYSILGASGCGKTTTLRCIAGLEQPSDGTIEFDDRDVTDLSPQQRDIEMIFQNIALYPHMTCRENIGYGLRINGVPKEERTKKIEAAAQTLQIADQLDKRPSELSGGQQQRVALARVFVKEPEIVLLDEPMSKLDAKLKEELRVELQRLHNELDSTFVYVTHDQTEAMTMSDAIILMDNGDVEQVGTPDELFDDPSSQHVASFIGTPSTNLLEYELTTDGNRTRIDELDLDLPTNSFDNSQESVTLGIRPQYLSIGSGDIQFDVTVNVIENLGTEYVIHGELEDGRDFDIVTSKDSSISLGDTITVSCDRSRVFLFDETGSPLLREEEKRATT